MSLDSSSVAPLITAEGIVTTQPAAPKTLSEQSKRARLYAAMWRWHFIAGLIVTPVLMIVALMGAVYVFHDELDPVIYPALLTVTPAASEVAYDTQLAAVKAAYPGFKITTVEHHPDADRAVKFTLRDKSNVRTSVYVNQYTGTVLGSLNESSSFFGVVLQIHRNLFIGTPGRFIVELMVCWSISSMLTGFYLGWKRTRKEQGRNRWLPRLRGRTKRSFLRELHIFGGGYVTLTAVLIMVTGLNFTEHAGDLIKAGAAQLGTTPAALQTAPSSNVQADVAPLGIDHVLSAYNASGATAEWRLTLPAKDTASYAFSANTSANLGDYRRAWIDQYTGAILADVRWDNLPLGMKITRHFYPIHTGSIFGVGSKIVMLVSCILIVVLGVTGVLMWWNRRPKGKFGVPARTTESVVPKGIIVLIVVLGLLMPLMGASLLVVLIGDWMVRRVRRAFVRA